jgi:hypothetical protein
MSLRRAIAATAPYGAEEGTMRARASIRGAAAALSAVAFATTLVLASPVAAATLEGVSCPDATTVGGKPVKLNGMGVRVAYVFVKVYVACLYLTTPSKDGDAAAAADEPKRMQLQFLREVSHTEMVDAMREGFGHTGTPALQPQVEQFAGYFDQPLTEGMQVVFDYVPGTGTTTVIGNKTKGTIPGPDFMRALFGIWLGKNPPNDSLKQGLLGQGS